MPPRWRLQQSHSGGSEVLPARGRAAGSRRVTFGEMLDAGASSGVIKYGEGIAAIVGKYLLQSLRFPGTGDPPVGPGTARRGPLLELGHQLVVRHRHRLAVAAGMPAPEDQAVLAHVLGQ